MIAPAAADVGRENINENIPMGLICQLRRRLNVNQVFSPCVVDVHFDNWVSLN